MPALNPAWFLPIFVSLWFSSLAVIARLGGWYKLSHRFKSSEPVSGQRFHLRSAAFQSGFLPVNYGSCLSVTIGTDGLALAILFPFRFFHPRLVIPWFQIKHCEEVQSWLATQVAIHVMGFNGRVLFRGRWARNIIHAWMQARAGTDS